LDLNTSQVNLILVVSNHHVLICIVPEKRVRSHLHNLEFTLGVGCVCSVVRVLFKVFQVNGDHGASLGVLDLEMVILHRVLEPVISIELRE
jgi:hypothetical protein